MADSTTNLTQIEASQAQKEVTANGLFDAGSSATAYGRRAAACTGLTWGYYGTRYGGTAIANGTHLCRANETVYMTVDLVTGIVDFSNEGSPTLWSTSGNGRVYKITTGASSVTSYEDHRFGPLGVITAASVAGSGDMLLASVQTVTGAKTFGSVGAVGKLKVAGTTSGSATIDAPAVAGTAVITLPGVTSTLATLAGTETLTNKTLTNAIVGTQTPLDNSTKAASTAYVEAAVTAGGGSYQPLDADLTTIAGLTATTDNFIQSKSSAWASRTPAQVAADLSSLIKPTECIVIACSDETTALTAGTAKVTFRMPYAFTLSDVRASVTTAPTGGTLLAVDVNEAGTTILSTKLTFDASEKTTTTAAAPRVISDSSLADDAEMTVDIDAVGSTIAGAGLKVYLIGSRT